ncbi:UvrD-helicase domain-containing protein [Mariniluteicoccus flavus]
MTHPQAPDSEPLPFDLTGPLPEGGTWVLEASAGTGKTYTIAALAARHVAAGRPISELMLVTFSRAATAELRDRVRGRLAWAESALRTRLAGGPVDADPVNALLATGTDEEVAERLHRLTTALADLDRATIATTHEFCGRMLDGLGVLADRDPLAEGVDQIDDLVREVAADLWLRKFSTNPDPDFTWDEATDIARAVTEHPDPPEPADDADQAIRLAYARALRAQVAERKRDRGLLTYDDLLTGLHALVEGRRAPGVDPDPELAASVRQRLRDRFPVVLIDEFQDTDPVQWAIVRDTFVGHSTVVLIGDPKQAIYAFRGADVHCYLAAIRTGDHHHTLDTNHRSDRPLVEAIGHVLGGAALGDVQIVVREVGAKHDARLRSPDPARGLPLRLRTLPTRDAPRRRAPRIAHLRDLVADDVVTEVATMLTDGTTITVDGVERPLRADDIAILVRRHETADDLRSRLSAHGIPAIHAGSTSVFDPRNPAGRDWSTLLRALEAPRAAAIREVALTDFVGWTFAELAEATDDRLNALTAQVRSWARVLDLHGVAALMEAMTEAGLAVRLLEQPDGDRRWTDLRHVAQALHAARTRDRLGTAGLVEWLTDRRREAATAGDERTRRLETDAQAVSIMTVHRSKGLEFPVVLLPDRWDHNEQDYKGRSIRYRGDDGENRVWIAGRTRGATTAHRRNLAEARDEALRLLYVAMTRAQCQVVAWWAANEHNTSASALHRVLHRGEATVPSDRYPWDDDPTATAVLAHPLVHVSEVLDTDRPPTVRRRRGPDADALTARVFDRAIDTEWRRTSYSGLTAEAHDAAHARPEGLDDDELTQVVDEPDDPADQQASPAAPARDVPAAPPPGTPSPMAALPRGADFGTLVHAVYETFDPAAPDLGAELERLAAHWLDRLPMAGLSPADLGRALLPSVHTTLGPISGGLRLCDIPARDRLPELDFEYPLAGGDDPRSTRATLREVADLVEAHLPAHDPLAAYADRLRDPLVAAQGLRGYLIGSIDAVLRVPADSTPDSSADHRYLVVDYKTNWLGPLEGDVPLLVEHYAPHRLAEAMMDAHYPLQALLYCVALHRYLRWRQPAYDPEAHLGGVAYLFVRGMAGPDTPTVDGTPHGVFAWHPPVALVEALSRLIDRGTVNAATFTQETR